MGGIKSERKFVICWASDTTQVENRKRAELRLANSPEVIRNAIKLLISHPAGRRSGKPVLYSVFWSSSF